MSRALALFTAAEFVPTRFDTAADKAKFANHFVRFVTSDFKRTLFPKWFYNRLSMTFGHIAHFNIHGFYEAQFSTTGARLRFLKQTVEAGGFGSPDYTYSDVEVALARWVRNDGTIARYEERLREETEASELATLALLREKYGV